MDRAERAEAGVGIDDISMQAYIPTTLVVRAELVLVHKKME